MNYRILRIIFIQPLIYYTNTLRYTTISVNDLEKSLQLKEDEFVDRFGRRKPTNNYKQVIFSCLSGKRAAQASLIAKTLGIQK